MWKIRALGFNRHIDAEDRRQGREKTAHSSFQCTWTGNNNASLSPK